MDTGDPADPCISGWFPDYAQGLCAVRKTVILLDSSPWKSWSENNDSYNGSGLSAEPVGPEMERWDMAEEPPAETADKDSEEGNKHAYLWPCESTTVKENTHFFLDFTAISWLCRSTPILKCMLCPFQSLQSEIVSLPRLQKNEALRLATVDQSATSAT